MWVERLDVRGFKRLAGTFELDERLTVVVGPNEAGKSSLAEAVVHSIWGFDRRERRHRADGSAWERCRPWDGRDWRIVATLVDHDGRRLRAEWDFAGPELRLLDAVTGEELTGEVAAGRGEYRLGEHLTGLTYADFRKVCAFDQSTLAAVERSDSLVGALRRAVESVDADVGVEAAEALLREFLRNEVGARSDSYNPLPSGPLRRDLDERDAVRDRIAAVEQAQVELARIAGQLAKHEQAHALSEIERRQVERAILVGEVRALRRRCEKADRLRRRAATAPAPDAGPDEALLRSAHERFGAVEEVHGAVERLERAAAAARPEAERLHAEHGRLGEEIAALDAGAAADPGQEAAVRERLAELRQLDAQGDVPPPPAVPDPDPELARYREARGALLALAGQTRVRWRARRLALAALVAIASAGLGVAVSPVAFAGVLVAAVLVATARTVTRDEALRERLRSEFGGQTIEELDRRASEEEQALATARAEADAAAAAAERRAAERAGIEAALTAALDAAKAEPGPLPDRAERYLERCATRARLDGLRARRDALLRQLHEVTEPERQLAARREELEERWTVLRATLERLGVEAATVGQARAGIARCEAERKAVDRQRADSRAAQERLEALLDGRTREELDRALREAERRLDEHQHAHPDVQAEAGDPDGLRATLREVERELAEHRQEIAALRAQVAEREADLPDVAELREQLAAAEERIARRELARDAIRIAREALRDAAAQAHRNFAPHLQRALERTLPAVTAGRYREVAIADDLSVSLVAPETGAHVAADRLSLGTQDQIFLVERLEIAKLLLPATGPVPLLLDEPFAEFDADRERAAVQVLAAEAETRQIVLFTKDARLIDRFAEAGETPHVIELGAPVEPAVPS